ncbi:MAG: hypothetical protein WCA83_10535 [Azonexus sp.]
MGQLLQQSLLSFQVLQNRGNSMYKTKYSFLALAAIALASCATTGDGSKWTCTAPGIMNSSYDGSGFAFVQLQGFANGHSYEVVKNSQGNEATGTTANGTRFVCKKVR